MQGLTGALDACVFSSGSSPSTATRDIPENPLTLCAQVADLEEERRKLRMEMKFRAKYHGQHALEMGLTNEKLLLLEQYADDLKNNRVEEARVVEQMQQRVRRAGFCTRVWAKRLCVCVRASREWGVCRY